MPDDRFPKKEYSKPTIEPVKGNKLTELLRRIYAQVAPHSEVVGNDPDPKTLQDFIGILSSSTAGGFKPEEIEPVETFQAELAKNDDPDSDVHFIFTALRDPQNENELVSSAYGSVHNGILAIRFTLTEVFYRATGISQKADELMVEEAKKFCDKKGVELRVYICEAVEKSEGYWNKQEIEPGNGMKRIYSSETGEQIHYELPPLTWNPDGTPAMEGITENLQVAIKGHPNTVIKQDLEAILRDWWAEWYIRGREQFENDEAWELHKQTVWDVLQEKILNPMPENLKLVSKKERKASEKST